MSTYPQSSSKKMNGQGKENDDMRPLTMCQKYFPSMDHTRAQVVGELID